MDRWNDSARRSAKLLLGRPARLLTAAWVIEYGDAPFFQGQAADRLSADFAESRTAVIAELNKLVELNMLHRMEDGQKVWYARRPSPLWQVLELAAECFGLLGSPREGGTPHAAPERRAVD